MTRKSVLWTFAGLVLVNLVIRLVWLWYMHPPQVDDFAWYFSHATQMYRGQGYVWYGHYTSYWPIGYPFFLSQLFHITGASVLAGLVANVFLSTGIVLLVYVVAKRIFESHGVALCAALGYTLLPSQIAWNSVLGSEELFTFLLLLSVVLLTWKHRGGLTYLACAGLVMGLAADVRPVVIVFPVFLLVYLYWFEKRSFRFAIVGAIVFAITMLIGIAPVTIRNYLTIHHFILVSTNGGVNLWQGTHANGSYFWSWNPEVNPLAQYVKNDYLENQVGVHAAVQYYLHHQLAFVVNGFVKIFFLYWVDWNVVSVTFGEHIPPFTSVATATAMWLMTIVYWIWMVICGFGLIRLVLQSLRSKGAQTVSPEEGTRAGKRGHLGTRWLPLVYILYNTAIFFLFPAWDRFRYPMMPLFAVYFGMGALTVLQKFKFLRRGSLVLERCDQK